MKSPTAFKRRFLNSLSNDDLLNLQYDWMFHARPKQLIPPGDWAVWLILSGRGFGKTRVGAETVRHYVESKQYGRIALIADTARDARDVMVEGESGIMETAHPLFRPTYTPSMRKVEWPNGTVAHTYSSEAFEALRGPQHDLIWMDELAKFQYAQETYDQAMFGLRLGEQPRAIITTTPRPIKIIKNLIDDPTCIVTTGSTFENAANLPAIAIERLKSIYEGTRLGQQELYAKVLTDNPNSLWKANDIDAPRIKEDDAPETYDRIVVAIDPAVTSKETSDETGIIVAAKKGDQGYVLFDGSMKGTPDAWCKKAITLYNHYSAGRIIGEVNNGGDLIETILRHQDRSVSYKSVRASRGKQVRAELIAALYEQHRIHHVGMFEGLESQMVDFDPTLGSKIAQQDDRMDALVWAITELFGIGGGKIEVFTL